MPSPDQTRATATLTTPVPRNGYAKASTNAAERVSETAAPPAARALSTLRRIDYADAFLLDIPDADLQTPEEWMRTIFDKAPAELRLRLWAAWVALGFRLSTALARDAVLGWPIRRSTEEFVLLGASSRIGMPAELLLMRHRRMLLFDTFVQQDNLLARSVWGAIKPIHVRTVPSVLRQFARGA